MSTASRARNCFYSVPSGSQQGPLVPEMPHPGKNHRHSQLIRRRNHVRVAHRPTRLDHRVAPALPLPPLHPETEKMRPTPPRYPSAHRFVAALITAIFTESTRLICPAPTPTVCPSRANTIAFDFTCLQTFHPKSSARNFCAGRRALRHHLQIRFAQFVPSGFLRQHPAEILFSSSSSTASPLGISSSRRFFFARSFSAPRRHIPAQQCTPQTISPPLPPSPHPAPD